MTPTGGGDGELIRKAVDKAVCIAIRSAKGNGRDRGGQKRNNDIHYETCCGEEIDQESRGGDIAHQMSQNL
jgi:hypothetical protein